MIVASSWFDYLILFMIFVNCVEMAIKPSCEVLQKNNINYYDQLEFFFQVFYTVEMVIKILALGLFFGKYSYFRDPWNILDFLIVAESWLTTYTGSGNLTAVRAVRALRVIRMISGLQRLQLLIQSLLKILKSLLKIAGIVFITVIVFACISM